MRGGGIGLKRLWAGSAEGISRLDGCQDPGPDGCQDRLRRDRRLAPRLHRRRLGRHREALTRPGPIEPALVFDSKELTN